MSLIGPKRRFVLCKDMSEVGGEADMLKTARPTRLMWWTVPAPDNELR